MPGGKAPPGAPYIGGMAGGNFGGIPGGNIPAGGAP